MGHHHALVLDEVRVMLISFYCANLTAEIPWAEDQRRHPDIDVRLRAAG